MNLEKLTWYVARSGGIVAWSLLALSLLLGLVLSSRILGRKVSPAWTLSVHRFLGGLSVAFTVIHVAAIMLDDFVDFGFAEVLVPWASTWRPGAVAWGIVAMYLMLAVEATSLAMRHLPKKLWRGVHWTSAPLFIFATLHGYQSGSDAGQAFILAIVAMMGALTALTVVRVVKARAAGTPRTDPRDLVAEADSRKKMRAEPPSHLLDTLTLDSRPAVPDEPSVRPKPEPTPVVTTPTPEPEPAFTTPTPEPASPLHTPTPTPEPEPAFTTPTPEPEPAFTTPTPEPASPLHTPTPEPEPAFTTPTPEPASPLHTPTPTPTPEPASPLHTPTPTPTPEPASPLHTPTPTPEPASPLHTPTPTPEPASPLHTPTPEPEPAFARGPELAATLIDALPDVPAYLDEPVLAAAVAPTPATPASAPASIAPSGQRIGPPTAVWGTTPATPNPPSAVSRPSPPPPPPIDGDAPIPRWDADADSPTAWVDADAEHDPSIRRRPGPVEGVWKRSKRDLDEYYPTE